MNKKLVAFLLSTGILVSTCGTIFANEVVVDPPVVNTEPIVTVNTEALPVNNTVTEVRPPQQNIEEPKAEIPKVETPEVIPGGTVNTEAVEVKETEGENTTCEMEKQVEELPKADEIVEKVDEGTNKATSTVSESGSKMGSKATSTSYSSTGTENPKTGDINSLGAGIMGIITGIGTLIVARRKL